MKKVFLVILLLGFLVLLGLNLDKINSRLFRATLVPFSPAIEELDQEISEEEPESLPVEISEKVPIGGPELTLTEIQEILDDIAERVDEISQEVADLLEEASPAESEQNQITELEVGQEEVGQEEIGQDRTEEVEEMTSLNRASGGGSAPVIYPKILISEIQISPIEQRFIELYNPNNQIVDLTDWYIQRKTETGTSWDSLISSTKFEGKSIQAFGYFSISRTSIADPDILLEDLTLTENNVILLKNPNREIVDKLGWGQAQDFELAPAENPSTGQRLVRKWSGSNGGYLDTDNNSNDFEIQSSEPEPEADTTPPEVVFNVGTTQTSLSFNLSWSAIDPVGNTTPSGIDGFSLQYSIIETTSPSQDGIFLWYQDNEGLKDWKASEILDLSEEKNSLSLLGKDEYTYSFQIKTKDKAGNESDWQETSTKINLPKIVLINEIQIDSIEGAGGTNDDWVELYNPNDWEINLSQWSIQRSPKSGTIYKKNFEADQKIPAKGYFLVVRNTARQELLDIADMTSSVLQLSADSTVYLVKNQEEIENGQDPNIVDKIGFGEQAFSPEGSPAPNPPEAKSIERKELGLDTNNNSQDFEINNTPSPTNSGQ